MTGIIVGVVILLYALILLKNNILRNENKRLIEALSYYRSLFKDKYVDDDYSE